MERKRSRKKKRKQKVTPVKPHDYDSILRMQSYDDFDSILSSDSLRNLIGKCYVSSRDGLEKMISNPETTVGELQAIALSTDAFDSNSASRMKSKEYVDNRLFGKVTDRLEMSGSDGGAIKIESDRQSFEEFLKTASKEQLEKLREVNKILKNE